MELLTITAKSFRLLKAVDKLIKKRKEYFISLMLLNPRADGKNIEAIIPLKGMVAGKESFFEGLEGYQKELIKSFLVPDTHLIVEFYAVKNSSKFMGELKKIVTAGAVAGVGLITGNISTVIGAAFLTEASKSVLDLIPNKKKVTKIGKAFMSYDMMKKSPTGKVHIRALDKILVDTTTEINPVNGEIRKTKHYIPGKFGIAEVGFTFRFSGVVV